MRPSVSTRACACACAALALAALPACAHEQSTARVAGGGEESADETLADLEDAFAWLREGKHDYARERLELATARFDEQALDGALFEKALASDPLKPYRGRPHERVLALVVLAALDIERDRCDLALPSLRSAQLYDLKASAGEASDAALVHALALRCLVQMEAQMKAAARGGPLSADVERARADLADALGAAGLAARFDEIVAVALADDVLLSLAGAGPTVVADGAQGERARVVPAEIPAKLGERVSEIRASPAKIAREPRAKAARGRAGAGDAGALIRLSRRAPAVDAHADAVDGGIVLWSSTREATTVRGRPFEEVLAARAEFRQESLDESKRLAGNGFAAVAQRPDARGLAEGAMLGAAGFAMGFTGALVDARADVRFVSGLFESAALLIASAPETGFAPADEAPKRQLSQRQQQQQQLSRRQQRSSGIEPAPGVNEPAAGLD